MSRTLVLLVLALIGAAPSAAAEERWLKIATPHFELYTNGGEGSGRRTALYFEQVRSFFIRERGGDPGKVSGPPIRIVGFRNEKSYEPYRSTEFAAAYYLRAEERDYIVIGDINAERHDTAVHEYAHLLIRSMGLTTLPPWLSEGMAEVYSSLEPAGKKVRIGDIPLGRMQQLQRDRLIPLAEFLAVDRSSPYYSRKSHAGMFYAQSCALTHMLMMSKEMGGQFERLVALIARGTPSDRALAGVYGMSLEELEKRLQAYASGQTRYYASLVPVKLEKAEEEAEIADADELETELLLGRLLGYVDREKGEERFAELAERFPDAPQVHEALGYHRWRSGDSEAAVAHFRRAVESGTTNARLLYSLSGLDREATPEEQRGWLQRALDLDPENSDVLTSLGLLHLREERWSQALITLRKVKQVETRDEAYRLYQSRAYALAKLGEYEQALTILDRAQEMAERDDQFQRIRVLRVSLDYRMRPPPEAPEAPATEAAADWEGEELARPELRRESPDVADLAREGVVSGRFANVLGLRPTKSGLLVHLECAGDTARITIDVDGTREEFLFDDPNNVALTGDVDGPFEFTCGPQGGQPVTVGFEVSGGERRVRELEFLETL